MKKLLIICSIALLASTSSFAYTNTIFASFYQDGNQIDMRVFNYTPNAWIFSLQLYAQRTQETYAPLCYVFVMGEYNGSMIFIRQAGASNPGDWSYLNETVYSYTTQLSLKLQCFFPAPGDRVWARIKW